MRHIPLWPVICLALFYGAVNPAAASAPLSLEEVSHRVMGQHPGMIAVQQGIEAAKADANQATRRANPALAVEVENVGGSGGFSGTDAAEYTVLLGQEIQLGGKIRERTAAADLEVTIATQRASARRRALTADTTKAFYSLLAAQERLELADRLVETAEDVVSQAERRVQAGGASPLERTKAELEAAQLRVRRGNAEQRLLAAQRTMAWMWGSTDAEGLEVSGDFEKLSEPQPFPKQLSLLEQHPDWARLDLGEMLLAQQVQVANADRIPNVEIGAGIRQDEASGDHAFVFEAVLPLPLFDRNQGARNAAASRVSQGRAEAEEERLDLRNRLVAADSAVRQAFAAALAADEELLPIARRSFELAEQGYVQGRFSVLDLLDAQRNLFEQEADYVELLEQYHHAWADLQMLISTETTE